MPDFPSFRSSRRKPGPRAFVRHYARDLSQDITGHTDRPKNWVQAFAGMSGEF
jgi:hypothetical protein